jgi:hypothetical protein
MKTPVNIIIPALANGYPGLQTVDVTGKVFTCFTANGKFSVRPDRDNEVPLESGQRFGTADSKEFSRLAFYNYTNAAVVVEGAASDDVIIPTQAVAAQVNNNVTVSGKNAPTYPKGTTVNLAAGATHTFNGLDGVNVRKSLSVFNDHAADYIYVDGQNTTAGHKVLAQQGFPVECGGSIRLRNPGANPITCYVMEVFYS